MTPPSSWRRTLKHELIRLRETPRTFRNWPTVLTDLARSKVGAGSKELTFKMRNGQQITVPNLPGARVPAYEVFGEDAYDLRWFLGELMDRPIHVFDICAHVGTFSSWLSYLHPQATIDCFEPAPDTAPYLRRNVEANRLGDRVAVHQKALAGETGWATFDQEGAGSGLNHLAMGDDLVGSGSQVETLAFDDAVRAARGPVEVIKLDCEGGEYELVYRSWPESWADVRRLVLEFHEVEGQAWSELRDWFAAAGLHVVRNQSSRESATMDHGMAWLSRDPLPDPEVPEVNAKVFKVRYDLRRIRQTPGAFRNWPSLLSGLAREVVGRGPDELVFETRTGLEITAPNVPGARLPAYEQFAEDGYRLDWFLGDLRSRPIHGLDVGAHVGTFACHYAQVHPTATLTCYEPSAGTARYLRANVEANGFADRVEVVEAALTGTTGFGVFNDLGGASVHSGLVHDGPAGGGGAEIRIPTLGFEDVVKAAPAPIEFIKLDCEGGEYQLAYQSNPESWASVQRVVLEYHDIPGESWAELRAWFASVGLHLILQKPTTANLGLAWLSRGPIVT